MKAQKTPVAKDIQLKTLPEHCNQRNAIGMKADMNQETQVNSYQYVFSQLILNKRC